MTKRDSSQRTGDLYEMIPATLNGLKPFECISAMQKCIRRGLEEEAMQFACEMIHTSKAFTSMVANRLEIIAHEDIDVMTQPWIVPFVRAACEQARDWYDPKKLGKSRMPIGNVIRLLSRAAKSREGDHFQAAVGLGAELDGFVPEVPEWALDQHTSAGRRMGRGIEHFLDEGTKLIPAPKPDPYQANAHRLWRKKHALKAG